MIPCVQLFFQSHFYWAKIFVLAIFPFCLMWNQQLTRKSCTQSNDIVQHNVTPIWWAVGTIVMTMPKRRVSSHASRRNYSMAVYLRMLDRRNRKPSTISKVITIESDLIQVWVTKVQWSLKYSWKLKTKGATRVLCPGKTWPSPYVSQNYLFNQTRYSQFKGVNCKDGNNWN